MAISTIAGGQVLTNMLAKMRKTDERYSRIVDELVIHGEALEFRELCDRVVTEDTRYLVFDLDRTFHFGHNMGELLGWEVGAWHCYGEEHLVASEHKRKPSRFFMDWSRPWATLRYLVRGARLWAYPGLLYLFCGKIGLKFGWSRRLVYRYFGVNALQRIQEVPRLALMHQLADVPLADLLRLSRRLWKRFEDSQTIMPEDIAYLKERYPNLKIIISSASPMPVLEIAKEYLNVDDIIFSAGGEADGYLNSPLRSHPLFLQFGRPRRIALPSEFRQNAARSKIAYLLERYPDFADPGVQTIGITDTSHGEDYSWADHFTKVVDINSPTPFPPIVSAASPLREIHSANVFTQAELRTRAAGEANYLDPRRGAGDSDGMRRFARAEMERLLAPVTNLVETLSAIYDNWDNVVAKARADMEETAGQVSANIEQAVRRYNESLGAERRKAFRKLSKALRADELISKRLLELERPLANLTCVLDELVEKSRRLLDHYEPGAESA